MNGQSFANKTLLNTHGPDLGRIALEYAQLWFVIIGAQRTHLNDDPVTFTIAPIRQHHICACLLNALSAKRDE